MNPKQYPDTNRPTIELDGVEVPTFIYGTAWKEERTAALVRLALEAGFRAIDTANQRRHYFEAAVGEALATAYDDGLVAREALFLQTKFTYRAGQDHRLPYDPQASLTEQVQQSFASSLRHLQTEYIDSYVLHGPSGPRVWADADRESWAAMETLHAEGKARLLGVSNVNARQLETLCAEAEVRPRFVQNRCFTDTGWDAEVRAVCRRFGVVYQGFSLLTANRAYLSHPVMQRVAERLGATVAQVVFRAAKAMGMIPLTGTSSPAHMSEDLAAGALELEADDVLAIERLAASR